MIEQIAILVFIPLAALAFWLCSMFKHGTCNMWKLITLSLTTFSLVAGVFLYAHAFAFLRTSKEDAAWASIAGIVLTFYSLQQIIFLFREIFATKVEPVKDGEERGT